MANQHGRFGDDSRSFAPVRRPKHDSYSLMANESYLPVAVISLLSVRVIFLRKADGIRNSRARRREKRRVRSLSTTRWRIRRRWRARVGYSTTIYVCVNLGDRNVERRVVVDQFVVVERERSASTPTTATPTTRAVSPSLSPRRRSRSSRSATGPSRRRANPLGRPAG